MNNIRIYTIGGYGFSEEAFVRRLQDVKVEALIDVRQRRGMRGSKYAFLNSTRLQILLAAIGIKYIHARDLAPNSDVRDAQKDSDRMGGVAKRDRSHLSSEFVKEYQRQILEKFEPTALRESLIQIKTVALFCVEGPPTACHRLLAADHLVRIFGSEEPVGHLRP